MAKGKKSKSSGNISNGGRQKRNLAHEEARQARFARRKEAGKEYVYTKNPYDKKSDYENWHDEDITRKEKAKSSKLPYARLTSIFAKLDNDLKKREELKKLEGKKNGKPALNGAS